MFLNTPPTIGGVLHWQCSQHQSDASKPVRQATKACHRKQNMVVTQNTEQELCSNASLELHFRWLCVKCSKCLLLRTQWHCSSIATTGVRRVCIAFELCTAQQNKFRTMLKPQEHTYAFNIEQPQCSTVSLELHSPNQWLYLWLRTRWQCFSITAHIKLYRP